MENQQENQQRDMENDGTTHDSTGKEFGKMPPEDYNDTGFAGTTNAVSAGEDAHDDKLAIEDTMIGYEGDDSQMDMDLNVDDGKNDLGDPGVDDNE
jgi:hypothetical protein